MLFRCWTFAYTLVGLSRKFCTIKRLNSHAICIYATKHMTLTFRLYTYSYRMKACVMTVTCCLFRPSTIALSVKPKMCASSIHQHVLNIQFVILNSELEFLIELQKRTAATNQFGKNLNSQKKYAECNSRQFLCAQSNCLHCNFSIRSLACVLTLVKPQRIRISSPHAPTTTLHTKA